MNEIIEKPKRGRKPAGIEARTAAQRKQDQRERQENRINERGYSEWTKTECLLVLSRPSLNYLAQWAIQRLAELYGDKVTVTGRGYIVTFADKKGTLPNS